MSDTDRINALVADARQAGIPPITALDLAAYAVFHRDPGDGNFVRAVLEGDLFAAARRADAENHPALATIANWVWLRIPAVATGPASKVDAWLAHSPAACADINDPRR